MARILTHHVNAKNPSTGKVQTFEPGEKLPQWADKILTDEDHVAYPEADKRAEATVKQWQASKLAAEAAVDIRD